MAFQPAQIPAPAARFRPPSPFVQTPQPRQASPLEGFAAMGQMQKDQAASRQYNAVAEGQELKNESAQRGLDQQQRIQDLQGQVQQYGSDPMMEQQFIDAKRKLYGEKALLALYNGDYKTSELYGAYSEANASDIKKLQTIELNRAAPEMTMLEASEKSNPEVLTAMDAFVDIFVTGDDARYQLYTEDDLNGFSEIWASEKQNPIVWETMLKQAQERSALRREISSQLALQGIEGRKVDVQMSKALMENQGRIATLQQRRQEHLDNLEIKGQQLGLDGLKLQQKIESDAANLEAKWAEIGIKGRNANTAEALAQARQFALESGTELNKAKILKMEQESLLGPVNQLATALEKLHYSGNISLSDGTQITSDDLKQRTYQLFKAQILPSLNRQLQQNGVNVNAIDLLQDQIVQDTGIQLSDLGRRAVNVNLLMSALDPSFNPMEQELTMDDIRVGDMLAQRYATVGEGAVEDLANFYRQQGVVASNEKLAALLGPKGAYIDQYARMRAQSSTEG